MPAAAVIPAPIAYIKVAAVKKLVVGSLVRACGYVGRLRRVYCLLSRPTCRSPSVALYWVTLGGTERFTLKKLECSKQGPCAWIMLHGIMEKDLGPILLVSRPRDNDREGRTGTSVLRR